MKYEQSMVERRHHTRVAARGAVIVRGEPEIHGRSVFVSESALEVRCNLGSLPPSLVDGPVEIELFLDDDVVCLSARLAHVRALTLVFAIDLPPAGLMTWIADHAALG